MKTFQKPLSKEEESLCIQALQAEDAGRKSEAKRLLIERNLRLVAHIAKKYSSEEELEDLISIGTIGLIKAVETFDPDKGVLRIHILAQLKYELLSCKTPRRLYGITYAPADFCGKEFISLDAPDLYRQDEALAAA